MIQILLLLLIPFTIFASKVDTYRVEKGQTYLTFLEKQKLPLKKLYYDLDNDDKILTQEIKAGVHYQILHGKNNRIEQILLPLNEELQIHIYQKNNKYEFEIIPIIYTKKTEILSTSITRSPHYDIYKATGSTKLASAFVSAFNRSLNFKRDLRVGDKLVVIYEQKYRHGKKFSMPVLKTAMIEMKKKKHYIYLNNDNRYYDEKGCKVERFLLARPVRGARISSYFSKRRFHPILKRWKAHLGIDYAARRGTPVRAAASGRISWAARMGSYGNLIKIKHEDNYETRYAHLKSFRKGIKRGKRVKKGDVIGYVGTTGRSTGPHLHFELRKKGRAINPLKMVQVTTKKLKGKKRKSFLKLKKDYDNKIELALKEHHKFTKNSKLEDVCYYKNN